MMRCKIDVGSEAVLTTEDGKVFVLDVSHEIWERDGKRQLPGAVADGLRCRPNEAQSWKLERRVVSGQLTRLEALEWIAAHLERSIPPMLREELKVCVTLEDGALRRRKAMASGRKDGGR